MIFREVTQYEIEKNVEWIMSETSLTKLEAITQYSEHNDAVQVVQRFQNLKMKEMRDRTALTFRQCRSLLQEAKWDVDKAISLARVQYPIPTW